MRTRTRREKGVALIAAAAAIAVLTVATMEFNYSTNVDYLSAANARDAMRAHFLARSVIHMTNLMIKVQTKLLDPYRKQLAQYGFPDVQIADFVSMLEVPMCGSKEEMAGMAGLASLDVTGIKGLGLDYGVCRVESFQSEDGKINLNCAGGTPILQNNIGLALTALVASPAYDPIFQERDGDNQFTDRQTFVKALIDYVDRDEAGFGASGQPEDYGYESMREPYKAKNGYIDSIEELQLVRGMDDRKWALFGNELTAYGGCKLNVSATQSPIAMMMVLFQAAKDKNSPVLADPRKLFMLAQRIAQARAMGLPFATDDEFISFAADPDAALGLKLGSGVPTGIPPVEGLELDKAEFTKVAKTGPRRTYKVVAAAQVGRVEKRIIAVWDNNTQNQNMRDPVQKTGAWIYWREE